LGTHAVARCWEVVHKRAKFLIGHSILAFITAERQKVSAVKQRDLEKILGGQNAAHTSRRSRYGPNFVDTANTLNQIIQSHWK